MRPLSSPAALKSLAFETSRLAAQFKANTLFFNRNLLTFQKNVQRLNQLGRPGDDSTVSGARQSSHVAVGLLAMEVLLKMDVVAQPGTEEPAVALTAREQQVLKLIAEGKTTKQIAFILGISFKTTVFYRTRLMEKLNIHETASLVRYAIRHGLIQP